MAYLNSALFDRGDVLLSRSMMRYPPPEVIASWPAPNYIDPPTRGNALLVTNVVFQTVATIAVVGRLYSRFLKHWFGIDDALIIVAYVVDVGLTAVIMLAKERYGWDRHAWDLPLNLLVPANKIAFPAKLLVGVTTTLIRLSLIFFYYRLLKDSVVKWYRYVLHVSTAYTLSVGITFIMLAIFECVPTQAYWTLPPIKGYCLNEGRVLIGAGVLNSFSDLLITVLPIPIIMRLQMPLRQRIGVCVLLSLGMVTTIAGAIRIYFTWDSLIASWDATWRGYGLWIVTSIEIHLGMICACAPAWKTLLQGTLKKLSAKISKHLQPSNNAPNTRLTAKKSYFNPFKNFSLIQHTRFDFEKTCRDTDESSTGPMEKLTPPRRLTGGARTSDVRNYEIPGTPTKPTKSAFSITRKYSIDQSSVHLTRIPVAPPQWIYAGSSGKSSPQKVRVVAEDASSFV